MRSFSGGRGAMRVNRIRVKLDDGGKGSIWISDAQGEHEIELAATTGVRILSQVNGVTLVTVRMLADVEFEGAAELTFEQAAEMFPEFKRLYDGGE